MRLRPPLAALGAALLLAGCAGQDRPPPRPLAVAQLERFPDLPLPTGWRPLPDEDQLAVSIGGGTARRLLLSLEAPPARSDLQPPDVLRQLAPRLRELGWQRADPGPATATAQRWLKGGEELTLRAERRGGLVVLHWRLVPAG